MVKQGVGMDKGFEERKRKYEEKWALDAELRFKATARRNKLLGRWAAVEIGLSADKVEDYARAVVTADLHEPGGDAAFRKVKDDLLAAGRQHTDAELLDKLAEFSEQARRQIVEGKA